MPFLANTIALLRTAESALDRFDPEIRELYASVVLHRRCLEEIASGSPDCTLPDGDDLGAVAALALDAACAELREVRPAVDGYAAQIVQAALFGLGAVAAALEIHLAPVDENAVFTILE